MRFLITVLMTLTIFATGLEKVHAQYDLFDTKKSDSAIKPLVFPKSMVVIRNSSPGYLPVKSDIMRGGYNYSEETYQRLKPIEKKFLENEAPTNKLIKKYLVRLDPARIAPSTRGKDFDYTLSRKALRKLGKEYDADLLFVFQQSINVLSEPWIIRIEGLIYLARQDKILIIPSNDHKLISSQLDLLPINQNSLEQLGKDARKVIMSHKYEKRRSNY
jgi:hypothetical protein